jgi:hypothetical protein
MAPGEEIPPQRGKVVELAVLGGPHRTVLVGHRLPPALHVHDAEPAGAEGKIPLAHRVRVVGPAMGQAAEHGADRVHVTQPEDPTDPAHVSSPPSH